MMMMLGNSTSFSSLFDSFSFSVHATSLSPSASCCFSFRRKCKKGRGVPGVNGSAIKVWKRSMRRSVVFKEESRRIICKEMRNHTANSGIFLGVCKERKE